MLVILSVVLTSAVRLSHRKWREGATKPSTRRASRWADGAPALCVQRALRHWSGATLLVSLTDPLGVGGAGACAVTGATGPFAVPLDARVGLVQQMAAPAVGRPMPSASLPGGFLRVGH